MGMGPFRFQMAKMAYEDLERRTAARWPVQERIGRRPALQFIGPDVGELNIRGTIYPEYTGGLAQVEGIAAACEAGQKMMVVSGVGRVFGMYVLLEMVDRGSFTTQNGTPRKVEFEVNLRRYGEDGASFGSLF